MNKKQFAMIAKVLNEKTFLKFKILLILFMV
jgi:hypothetical protein